MGSNSHMPVRSGRGLTGEDSDSMLGERGMNPSRKIVLFPRRSRNFGNSRYST